MKKDKTFNSNDYFAVCDHGTRHRHISGVGFEECNCKDKFGVLGHFFLKWAMQKHGIQYAVDITEAMQQDFLEEKRLKQMEINV